MADSTDVIMSICDKQWSRALQWETHRAMMTNALLVGFALLQLTIDAVP